MPPAYCHCFSFIGRSHFPQSFWPNLKRSVVQDKASSPSQQSWSISSGCLSGRAGTRAKHTTDPAQPNTGHISAVHISQMKLFLMARKNRCFSDAQALQCPAAQKQRKGSISECTKASHSSSISVSFGSLGTDSHVNTSPLPNCHPLLLAYTVHPKAMPSLGNNNEELNPHITA